MNMESQDNSFSHDVSARAYLKDDPRWDWFSWNFRHTLSFL